jgi:TatA/E family protein of Tat protein translocase
MGGIGMQELIIILVIVLLIFGPKKLPEIGKGLGKAIRDFRKGVSGGEENEISQKENEPEDEQKKVK